MIYEDDSARMEAKAIETYVKLFDGSFTKLDPNDIDYKVYNRDGELISYVEVVNRYKILRLAYPLPILAKKMVKLVDKRLNPIILWSCEDGIMYTKATDVVGEIKWGGYTPIVTPKELIIYF